MEHLLFFCHKMMAEEINMDYIWMTARSLTQAQKMVRVLKSAGIEASLQRARGAAAAKGCGYMVGVKRQEEKRAKAVLAGAGIVPPYLFEDMQEAEHDLF